MNLEKFFLDKADLLAMVNSDDCTIASSDIDLVCDFADVEMFEKFGIVPDEVPDFYQVTVVLNIKKD